MTARRVKIRYCFNCKRPLDFTWYMINSVRDITKRELKFQIWNNKYIQLFCCGCYNAFSNGIFRIRNKRLEELFSKSKIEPEQKQTIRDIIRNIDPIDYKTLERF